MSMKQILIGFVPWFVFSIVATRAGAGAVGVAALLACLIAVGMLVKSVNAGSSPKLLEVVGAVVFAGITVASFADSAADDWLADYGRALAAAILALVILVLLPVLPFTEQYARESVPREYWHTREFHAVNRRISAAWGGVIAAMAVGHAVGSLLGAGASEEPGVGPLHRPVDLLFNWIIPALLAYAAVRYTARVTAEAHEPPHDRVRQAWPS